MATAREIVRQLDKGTWRGSKGVCRCPAHDDRSPSLSVADRGGKILVHCFGGCPQERVITALRSLGLWGGRDDNGDAVTERSLVQVRDAFRGPDEAAAQREARAIWFAAKPISNERCEARLYLWWRGIMPLRIPPSLRFHPALFCSEIRQPLPALIAAIQDSAGRVISVQRTWLSDRIEIESDKPAPPKGNRPPLVAPKKCLGPMGAGAIRLGPAGGSLGIAEGIETALAAAKLYSLPVWAAAGAWRMGSLWIPERVERVVLFADAGDAGKRAASRAQLAYEARGLTGEIVYPPEGKSDFADCLTAC